jgi:hypothetical protein
MGRRKVTGAQLAKRLGVSAAWVSYRINGQVSPSVADLDRIAEALSAGVVDLLPRDRRDATVTNLFNRPPVHSFSGWPASYGGPTGPGRTSRTHPSPANSAGVFLASKPTNDNREADTRPRTVTGR